MATIKDVAKRAGVSPSTASRAMHDSSLISEETKKKVRKAMKELDYSPNFAAQNLARQTSNTIGVILPAREDEVGDNPFFIQIIQGLATICNAHDQLVSVATGQTSAELIKNIKTMIKRGNVTNFVFVYSMANDPVLEFVKQHEKIHYVVIGSPYMDTKSCYYVDNDNQKAGYDVTKFLLAKGLETIVYMHTDLNEKVQKARFMGYKQAMKEAGLEVLELSFEVDEKKTVHELSKLAKGKKKIGVIACDDILAIDIQQLTEQERTLAAKLALVGFNNSFLAKLARPSLTSVEIFPRFLGSEAAALAINSKGRDTLKLDTDHVIVPHKIIERDSTKF